MYHVYRTYGDGPHKKLEKLPKIEKGTWVNVIAPSLEEITEIESTLGIPDDYLRAALDEEESVRLDSEDGTVLLVIDMPYENFDANEKYRGTHSTLPMGIILGDDYIVTVSLNESLVLQDFISGKVKDFSINKKTRFLYQILYRTSTLYLRYLRQIDRITTQVEKELHKSYRNSELIQLVGIEKSLVYFSTSLKSNELVLEKLFRQKPMKTYPEDEELLEDVIIENRQAMEMANLYNNILGGTIDAFSSVISNNLNIVMKWLAAITIVFSVPTIMSGLWGMNVPVPFQENPYGFLIVSLVTIGVTGIVALYLYKKDMF
ncbi:magnesium transporter CorA family protein [Clostridiales bacterium COT073_COT-073]|nr:magnesium transporter CorA family protein [Clostridiales bacterium COT073_COT-073]